MYRIETLLDLVKESQGLESDRALAKTLGVSNMSDYRKDDGVVPSDKTALKISELSGLRYEVVLTCCHGATAKKNGDTLAVKAWARMFHLARTAGFD